MGFEPVKKQRLYHDIIYQIKHEIELGSINPGDQLPSERKMAEALSVSRTTVKEAISVLDSAGLVSIRPGVGVFLRDTGVEDIILKMNTIMNRKVNLFDLLEFRQAIETDAAFYAALRRTEEDIIDLEKAYGSLEKAVFKKQVAAEEDFLFHLVICRTAKNNLLEQVIALISEQLIEGMSESRSKSLKTEGKSEAILKEHRLIVEEIIAGDANRARDKMWEHLQNVKKRFM